MKEFDYEKAKAGAPVCTRDGMPARIICWNFMHPFYKIIALADRGDSESILSFSPEGKYDKDKDNHFLDLMMAPVKHEGWVLIDPEGPHCIAHIYNSKEEAEEDAEREIIAYSAIAHIEWEE